MHLRNLACSQTNLEYDAKQHLHKAAMLLNGKRACDGHVAGLFRNVQGSKGETFVSTTVFFLEAEYPSFKSEKSYSIQFELAVETLEGMILIS